MIKTNSLDQSLPRNYDPVHLLFHRSDSSCFYIYSFLRPLIIRAGHWKLTKLVSTFGKKLITITDVLITVSGIFVMHIVVRAGIRNSDNINRLITLSVIILLYKFFYVFQPNNFFLYFE